jgi:hypothetical protein
VEGRKTSAGNLECVLVLGQSAVDDGAVDVRARGPFLEGACLRKVALQPRHGGTEPPVLDS